LRGLGAGLTVLSIDEFAFQPAGAIQVVLPMLNIGGSLILTSSAATHDSAGARLAQSRPVEIVPYGDAISRIKKLTARQRTPMSPMEILTGPNTKSLPASVIPIPENTFSANTHASYKSLKYVTSFGWWNPGAVDPENQAILEQVNQLKASMIKSYRLASIPMHQDATAVQDIHEMMDPIAARTELDNESAINEPRPVFSRMHIELLQSSSEDIPENFDCKTASIYIGVDPADGGRSSKAAIFSLLTTPNGQMLVRL
jgi:hypothetical protein